MGHWKIFLIDQDWWGFYFCLIFFLLISYRDSKVWLIGEKMSWSSSRLIQRRKMIWEISLERKGSEKRRMMWVGASAVWLIVVTRLMGQRILWINILSWSIKISGNCLKRKSDKRCLKRLVKVENNFSFFINFRIFNFLGKFCLLNFFRVWYLIRLLGTLLVTLLRSMILEDKTIAWLSI